MQILAIEPQFSPGDVKILKKITHEKIKKIQHIYNIYTWKNYLFM